MPAACWCVLGGVSHTNLQPPDQLQLWKEEAVLDDAKKLADLKVENDDVLALCYATEGESELCREGGGEGVGQGICFADSQRGFHLLVRAAVFGNIAGSATCVGFADSAHVGVSMLFCLKQGSPS